MVQTFEMKGKMTLLQIDHCICIYIYKLQVFANFVGAWFYITIFGRNVQAFILDKVTWKERL